MVTESECLEALREAAERLGESPTKAQYEALGMRPAASTVLRVVGGWNEAKQRAGLEVYSQDMGGGVPIRPKPKEVALPEGFEWESLTPQQRWYYKNREHRIAVKERRRRELRQWFDELKRARATCTRCDEDRPRALDFHHPDEKTHEVSWMVRQGFSRRRIREEMQRCTVLCANCHRKEHYSGTVPAGVPTPGAIERRLTECPKHEKRRERRLWIMAYKRESDGCSRCEETSPLCLDFHHQGEKQAGIGALVSFGRSLAEIRAEIEACVLLCANCHRVEHLQASTGSEVGVSDSQH